jgi:hypothetical protein
LYIAGVPSKTKTLRLLPLALSLMDIANQENGGAKNPPPIS